MENTNVKFGTLVALLSGLIQNPLFAVKVEPNITSTNYGTNSLEMALRNQVTEDFVTNLGEEDEQPQAPTRRITITIIGRDNEQTVNRKIEIAQAMAEDRLTEILPSDTLKNSDRLIDVMDGFFGRGAELDRIYLQEKADKANQVPDSACITDSAKEDETQSANQESY